MFIGIYNGSVVLTYLGVTFGTAGIYFTLNGRPDEAMICLILAGLCDLFDGTVARRFRRDEQAKEFGRQIDSLSDMISFLALPLVFGLTQTGEGLIPLLVYILYVLAGIIRLAYFNLTGVEETAHGRYYHGLPVTYAALVFPLAYLPLSFLPPAARFILWPSLCLLVGAAFLIDLRVPKPDRTLYIRLVLLAAVLLALYGLAVVYR